MWATAKDFLDNETMLTVRVSRYHRWGQPPEFSYTVGILNPSDDTMRKFVPYGGPEHCEVFSLLVQKAGEYIAQELDLFRKEEEKRENERKAAMEESRRRELEKRARREQNLTARKEQDRRRTEESKSRAKR